MAKHSTKQQTQLYLIFWVIIIGLVVLIGWFAYILIRPDATTPAAVNQNQINSSTADATKNSNTNKDKKKKNNSNTNNTNVVTNEAVVTNENTNTVTPETNTNNTNNTNEAGLVEPDETATDDGTTTVTLYFPKGDSACGEVYPVERKIVPTDDLYGQIILEDMHGPTEEEGDYDNAVTSAVRLRQVEYTADGPLLTLNEGYNELDECQQATVAAQLIKTANAMFELPEDTAGQVVVGEVTEDTEESEDVAEDNE